MTWYSIFSLFSVNKASRKLQDPTYEDWYHDSKIFRYLKDKPNYVIKYTHSNNFNFKVYVNANLDSDKETRKSTINFLMLINSAFCFRFYGEKVNITVSTNVHNITYSINIFSELGINIKIIIINIDNKWNY